MGFNGGELTYTCYKAAQEKHMGVPVWRGLQLPTNRGTNTWKTSGLQQRTITLSTEPTQAEGSLHASNHQDGAMLPLSGETVGNMLQVILPCRAPSAVQCAHKNLSNSDTQALCSTHFDLETKEVSGGSSELQGGKKAKLPRRMRQDQDIIV